MTGTVADYKGQHWWLARDGSCLRRPYQPFGRHFPSLSVIVWQGIRRYGTVCIRGYSFGVGFSPQHH